MLGPLPRLHRWVVTLVGGLAGAAVGAWVSSLASAQSMYSCSDVLLGVCVAPAVNLLPVVGGLCLGLLAGLLLVYDPHDPHRVARERHRDRSTP